MEYIKILKFQSEWMILYPGLIDRDFVFMEFYWNTEFAWIWWIFAQMNLIVFDRI